MPSGPVTTTFQHSISCNKKSPRLGQSSCRLFLPSIVPKEKGDMWAIFIGSFLSEDTFHCLYHDILAGRVEGRRGTSDLCWPLKAGKSWS